MYDFIYNLWFIYNELCMMGMGEKTRNAIKRKKCENQGKNSPLVALPSLRLQSEGRLFSGVWKHRKQAGPTLDGWRILA